MAIHGLPAATQVTQLNKQNKSQDLEQDEPVHTQESPANGSNAASEGSNAIIEIRPAKPFCVAFSF